MRASVSVETRVGSWCWSCRPFAGETYGRGETAQVRLCGGVVWAVGWGARITGLGWMGKVLKAIGWAGIGMGWEGWDGWDELGWVRRCGTDDGRAAVTRRMQGCVRCGGHHEVHGEALKGIGAERWSVSRTRSPLALQAEDAYTSSAGGHDRAAEGAAA